MAHLAGDFARTLRDNQPDLGITEQDILSLQVAGLCHDLGNISLQLAGRWIVNCDSLYVGSGHGPGSHMFDHKFLAPAIMNVKNNEPGTPVPEFVEHEVRSVRMLKALIEEQNLWDEWRESGLDEMDLLFIEECIDPPAEPKGRGKEKGVALT